MCCVLLALGSWWIDVAGLWAGCTEVHFSAGLSPGPVCRGLGILTRGIAFHKQMEQWLYSDCFVYDLIYHRVITKLGVEKMVQIGWTCCFYFLFLVSFFLFSAFAWKIFISLVVLLSPNHFSAPVGCVCSGISVPAASLTHSFSLLETRRGEGAL